jgi:hypothetical protein
MGWFDWLVEALSAGFEEEMNRRTVQFFGGRFEVLGASEWSERQTRAEGTSRTGRLAITINAGVGKAPW